MPTTPVPVGVRMIALQEIRTDRNVRQQLVAEEVAALTRSIKLLGQLTPVSVRPDQDGGYVLIAGHKRCAALAALGQTEVRAEIRADDTLEESERAAENIVRSALNPYEPSTIGSDATFGVSAGCDGAWQRGDVVSSAWCECAA
jgi:ParB/RepB/Spo0J family partition protein